MARISKDPVEKTAKEVSKARRTQDLKEVIKFVLASPLKDKGEVIQADGKMSLESLSKANTDVQTRMIMQIAKSAATGDVKSAEFLAKYGGLEPPKQQHVSVDLPVIIDDMTNRKTPVVSAMFKRDDEDDDED